MDIAKFHLNLLGRDRDLTPERYWLTLRHRELYTGFESGVRGYAKSDCEGDVVGTLVLALFQTHFPKVRPVFIIAPKPKHRWLLNEIKEMSRYIFRSRRGKLAAAAVLRASFEQLRISERPNHMPDEEGWVFFGFSQRRLPLWAKGQLLGGP